MEAYKQRLENDPDYEMSEEMQEEYWGIKEELEILGNSSLMKKFRNLSEEYENPESVS